MTPPVRFNYIDNINEWSIDNNIIKINKKIYCKLVFNLFKQNV